METIKAKANATSRASTTTLADDPDLVCNLSASAIYALTLYLRFNTTVSNSQGVKIRWNYSGSLGSAGFHSFGYQVVNTSSGFMSRDLGLNVNVNFTPAVDGTDVAIWTGEIHTDSAGVFSLQWAQQSSSANASSILEGSYMRLARAA